MPGGILLKILKRHFWKNFLRSCSVIKVWIIEDALYQHAFWPGFGFIVVSMPNNWSKITPKQSVLATNPQNLIQYIGIVLRHMVETIIPVCVCVVCVCVCVCVRACFGIVSSAKIGKTQPKNYYPQRLQQQMVGNGISVHVWPVFGSNMDLQV